MKRCPECRRDYYDDTLSYCLDDGAVLVEGPARDEAATAMFTRLPSEAPTREQIKKQALPQDEDRKEKSSANRKLILAFVTIFVISAAFFAYRYFTPNKQIDSIAVMPFVNDSGSADVEYLSDGMTETLIGSLKQIAKLNVKARSSVFRYKGKETDAKTIGRELDVQAILNGRIVQRGQDLILYVELVDAQTENSLWKETYNKTMTNLVALQNDVARDVAENLKVKLTGADQQKLAKNFTVNAEAYQLYLRGRYHALKLTPPELLKGISYFQQAIGSDPNYALAYVGLSDAYRSISIVGEMPPTEYLPKSKAAAQKAIELDDTLAEAHAALGFSIFRYDWGWSESEKECKRALELDPNSADVHQVYAHLLSNTGRHPAALAEIKRAREIDPLNLRIGALEGQFLIHADKPDEALASLRKIFELDPDYYVAHMFAASAYIDKGMFAEAVSEARRTRELSDVSSLPTAFLGYALSKSGKQAEARSLLDKLLKLSSERYVSPYAIALIYNGLNERDEAVAWLERGLEKRDVRMTYLKVEPKWNSLRDHPRFQEILKKIGFP